MTAHTSLTSFVFVDRGRACLTVAPALAGVATESRVVIYDHATKRTVDVADVAGGTVWTRPLREVLPLRDHSLRLQTLAGGRWADVASPCRLDALGALTVTTVSPTRWGVDQDCLVRVRHQLTREILAEAVVERGQSVDLVHEVTRGFKLQLDIFSSPDSDEPGKRLLSPVRLAPPEQRGLPPAGVDYSEGPGHTIRRQVVLSPVMLKGAGGGGLATHGFIGARSDGEPVVEAMDFVLGRQRYLYQPECEPVQRHEGRVIYLGLPHGSWGHFLIQGLARVWYALRHSELPVVWDSRALPQYQNDVLEVIGLKNPQIHLSEPTVFDEVVFPFPGTCLGDYVTPEFARSIGLIRPAPTVPGKKIFLSRSGLDLARGAVAGGLDADLDSIAERHGFTLLHPEARTIPEQLAELSSAEVVLGVEGSALHTPLLLQDPLTTRFWALSRHRGGNGVFDHIKKAKGLKYETLNFLEKRMGGARGEIALDLPALDAALEATSGLEKNFEVLDGRLERPSGAQTSYEAHLENTQVTLSALESDLLESLVALRRGRPKEASALLSSHL